MVYCGRPSKACQRCRARKLRCDLRREGCTQCLRAAAVCGGYRDTQQLRIRNESQAVQTKHKRVTATKARLISFQQYSLQSFPLPIELEAREAFFISRLGYGWEFLHPFYHPFQTPEHVSLSIEAVSLAYLSHQVSSEKALTRAKEQYIAALRLTSQAVESSKTAVEATTLVASLLLDLFEKITNEEPLHDHSWINHVNGALALVRLRGLDNFTDPDALMLLVRLSTNLIISCVASDTPVPEEVTLIRAHAEQYLDGVDDPKWRGTGLMVNYTHLRAEIRSGLLPLDEMLRRSMELDSKIRALTLEIPEPWSFRRTSLPHRNNAAADGDGDGLDSERIYGDYFDTYADRRVTQTWNVMRLIRILINEYILEKCADWNLAAVPASDTGIDHALLSSVATATVRSLAEEICASAPQYTDCFGLASRSPPVDDPRGTPLVSLPSPPQPSRMISSSQQGFSPSSNSESSSSTPLSTSSASSLLVTSTPSSISSISNSPSSSSSFQQNTQTHMHTHTHSPSRYRDVYTLIFPLYVAAWARGSPPQMKTWVVKQLNYMSEHFVVKNAGVTAGILVAAAGSGDSREEKSWDWNGDGNWTKERREEDMRIHPWRVYAMLGSYAFAAC